MEACRSATCTWIDVEYASTPAQNAEGWNCGNPRLTRYRIAQDTGIDESTRGKFYHGTRGLSLDNLDLLCEYLSLRIVVERKPTKKGK